MLKNIKSFEQFNLYEFSKYAKGTLHIDDNFLRNDYLKYVCGNRFEYYTDDLLKSKDYLRFIELHLKGNVLDTGGKNTYLVDWWGEITWQKHDNYFGHSGITLIKDKKYFEGYYIKCNENELDFLYLILMLYINKDMTFFEDLIEDQDINDITKIDHVLFYYYDNRYYKGNKVYHIVINISNKFDEEIKEVDIDGKVYYHFVSERDFYDLLEKIKINENNLEEYIESLTYNQKNRYIIPEELIKKV